VAGIEKSLHFGRAATDDVFVVQHFLPGENGFPPTSSPSTQDAASMSDAGCNILDAGRMKQGMGRKDLG
jgi:hypothetical protein